jgi:hypothetical protein
MWCEDRTQSEAGPISTADVATSTLRCCKSSAGFIIQTETERREVREMPANLLAKLRNSHWLLNLDSGKIGAIKPTVGLVLRNGLMVEIRPRPRRPISGTKTE